MPLMKETELFLPIKQYLEAQGYDVKGEVLSCDITAAKDTELVAIELKTQFSLKLVLQAIKHQEAVDSVYVAIPVQNGKRFPPNFRDIRKLLKRLELGLIFVYFLKKRTRVEIMLHPAPYKKRRNHKRRHSIIKELAGRYKDFNTGGSRARDERMTAYRQSAIEIACCLDLMGQAKPARLKEIGTDPRTSSILQKNFYGWFERVSNGIYTLSPLGKNALERYAELAAYARSKYAETINEYLQSLH